MRKESFEKIGHYFRDVRRDSGLTQAQLADLVGLSTSQLVSNWERGLCAPPMKIVSKLVTALNLDVEEVLDLFAREYRRELKSQMPKPNLMGQAQSDAS